jgi:hypothetical protein
MRLPDCPVIFRAGEIKHRWRPAVRDLGRGLVGFQFTFDSVNGSGAEMEQLRYAQNACPFAQLTLCFAFDLAG